MMVMIREQYRSGSGMQNSTPQEPCPGTSEKMIQGPRLDVAHLLKAPLENASLLREIAIGHRDPQMIHKSAGNACALSQRFVATQPMPSASSTAHLPILPSAPARTAPCVPSLSFSGPWS